MTIFKSAARLYLKNYFLSVLTLIFMLGSTVGLLSYYMAWRATQMNLLHFLTVSLMVAKFFPIFFMFLSYEYFYKSKAVNLAESIHALHNGSMKFRSAQFMVMILINLIITLLITLIQVFVYMELKVYNTEYLMHILAAMGTYVFLPSLVGIFIGLFAAVTLKRIKAYLLLIVFTLLMNSVFNVLFIGLYNGTGIDMFGILDLFAITAPSLNWTPNGHFGISMLSYQYQQMAFWIFGALAVVLFYLLSQRKKVRSAVVTVCAVLCIGSVVLYFLPASRMNMNTVHIHGSLAEQKYYEKENVAIKEERPDFQITGYRLDLKPGRELKVKAELALDQPDLEVYKFTLYHGYRVSKVLNQSGMSLDFTQEGDYLQVHKGDAPVQKLTLHYAGASSQYYANRQGIFLPGHFAYYPHSGYYRLTSDQGYSVNRISLPATTAFHLTVHTNQRVYSNLPSDGNGGFAGKADSVTLMSGFLTSIDVNGTEVIYPYLDPEYTPEFVTEQVTAFLTAKKDEIQYHKIFMMPGMNYGDKNFAVAYHDYLNLYYLPGILPLYEKNFIPESKHMLYDILSWYEQNRERYENEINFIERHADEIEDVKKEGQTLMNFNNTLQTIGEDKLIKASHDYLNDNSDTRSPEEFLNALQVERGRNND